MAGARVAFSPHLLHRGDFISLQHVLGPFVQKHWRQDWQLEPKSIHEYVGRRQWKRRDLTPNERRGMWSQAVYQVDDTPRYASVGRWEHTPSFSAWAGERTGYWKATAPFWTEVRRAWDEKLASSDELRVGTECRGQPVFVELFAYAEKLQGDAPPGKTEMREFIDEMVDCITRPARNDDASAARQKGVVLVAPRSWSSRARRLVRRVARTV